MEEADIGDLLLCLWKEVSCVVKRCKGTGTTGSEEVYVVVRHGDSSAGSSGMQNTKGCHLHTTFLHLSLERLNLLLFETGRIGIKAS